MKLSKKKTEALNAERQELYDTDFTDAEMAAYQNVDVSTIISWRLRRHLQANTPENKKPSKCFICSNCIAGKCPKVGSKKLTFPFITKWDLELRERETKNGNIEYLALVVKECENFVKDIPRPDVMDADKIRGNLNG